MLSMTICLLSKLSTLFHPFLRTSSMFSRALLCEELYFYLIQTNWGPNVPYQAERRLLKCLNRTLIAMTKLNKLDFNWYLINLFANSPIPLARLMADALSGWSDEQQRTCQCTNYNLDNYNPKSFVINVT
jgi:hypothetical protein